MSNSQFFFLGLAMAIPVIVIVAGFLAKDKKRSDFIKDVLVPVSVPLVVAVVGIVFTLQSEERQRADEAAAQQQQRLDQQIAEQKQRADQQTAIMRDVIASQERRDISFLTSVDAQLESHFERYANTNDQFRAFDEEAIFFFYGLHRAELVNLAATKGGLMFARIWIEEAYNMLAQDVVFEIFGTDELDPNSSPQGEAVIYKYFGNTSLDDAKGSGATPLLMDFHAFLTGKNRSLLTSEEASVLKNEFHNFQDRLHKNEIDRIAVRDDIVGMNGLWVYCYNNSFADWYGLSRSEIPKTLPKDAPAQFMDSFISDLTDGTNVWNRIHDMTAP